MGTIPQGGSGFAFYDGETIPDPADGAEGDVYAQRNSSGVLATLWKKGTSIWNSIGTIPSGWNV